MVEFGTLGEVFIIMCATLILLGPKEIPTVLKTIGRFIYALKKIVRTVRAQIDPYIQEGEFESFKQENNVYSDKDKTSLNLQSNPSCLRKKSHIEKN